LHLIYTQKNRDAGNCFLSVEEKLNDNICTQLLQYICGDNMQESLVLFYIFGSQLQIKHDATRFVLEHQQKR